MARLGTRQAYPFMCGMVACNCRGGVETGSCRQMKDDAFAADEQNQRQWRVFVEAVAIDPGALADVVNELARLRLRPTRHVVPTMMDS